MAASDDGIVPVASASAFDAIVKLNCRGTHMEVPKNLLLSSSYFNSLFGGTGFTSVKPDAEVFVDCDADVFREMLAYLEFGARKYSYLHSTLMVKIFDKFGVPYKVKTPEVPRDDVVEFRTRLIAFLKPFLEQLSTGLSAEENSVKILVLMVPSASTPEIFVSPDDSGEMKAKVIVRDDEALLIRKVYNEFSDDTIFDKFMSPLFSALNNNNNTTVSFLLRKRKLGDRGYSFVCTVKKL